MVELQCLVKHLYLDDQGCGSLILKWAVTGFSVG